MLKDIGIQIKKKLKLNLNYLKSMTSLKKNIIWNYQNTARN